MDADEVTIPVASEFLNVFHSNFQSIFIQDTTSISKSLYRMGDIRVGISDEAD